MAGKHSNHMDNWSCNCSRSMIHIYKENQKNESGDNELLWAGCVGSVNRGNRERTGRGPERLLTCSPTPPKHITREVMLNYNCYGLNYNWYDHTCVLKGKNPIPKVLDWPSFHPMGIVQKRALVIQDGFPNQTLRSFIVDEKARKDFSKQKYNYY